VALISLTFWACGGGTSCLFVGSLFDSQQAIVNNLYQLVEGQVKAE
jgi:hypothetical protein